MATTNAVTTTSQRFDWPPSALYDSPMLPRFRMLFLRGGDIALLASLYAGLLWAFLPFGPDPVVDTGRELYVPWAMNQGLRLHQDIAYFNGPLSPHFNAWLYSLLPASLNAWKLSNAAFVGLAAAAAWVIVARAGGRLAAFVSTTLFLSVFGFQHLPHGLMNRHLTPYSHEMVHSLPLCFLLMLALQAHLARPRSCWPVIAGVVTGLLALMKPEFTLAAIVAVPSALWNSRRPSSRWDLAAAVSAAIAVVAVAFLLQCSSLGFSGAAQATLGAWPFILRTPVSGNTFYRWILGLRDWKETLWLHGQWLLVHAVLWFSVIARSPLVTVAGLAVWAGAFFWGDLGPSVTVGMPWALAWLTWSAFRRGGANGRAWVGFALLSLVLLGKIFFRSLHYGYGFALLAPGAVALAAAPWALGWGGRKRVVMALLCLTVSARVVYQGWQMAEVNRPYPVRLDAGEFFPGYFYQDFADAVDLVEQHVPKDASLLAFPEGLWVNVLTRRRHPSRYTNFMPPEFDMYGESAITEDVLKASPDFILLVDNGSRPHFIYFANVFHGGYAGTIMRWIHEQYAPVGVVGRHGVVYRLLKKVVGTATPSRS